MIRCIHHATPIPHNEEGHEAYPLAGDSTGRGTVYQPRPYSTHASRSRAVTLCWIDKRTGQISKANLRRGVSVTRAVRLARGLAIPRRAYWIELYGITEDRAHRVASLN